MKIFVSLLPLLTALIAGGANEALPCEEKAVQEISCRTQIVCDVECDAPEYDFDAEETDKARPRPPLRRPQPRKSDVRDANAERYEDMKKELDETFKVMFDLKKELDDTQTHISAKWDEYYSLKQAYDRQLQKIINAWLTESLY